MEPRLDFAKSAPRSYKGVLQLYNQIDHCGLDPMLLTLVQLRISDQRLCLLS